MSEENFSEFLKREPLAKFSVYTQIQIQHLWTLSSEVNRLMDSSIRDRMFYMGEENNLGRVYGDFWLWVLGAYEVTRTMSHYPTCFSSRFSAEILAFKKQIAALRMPFAKLQFQGSNEPINSEASIYSMDMENRDLCFRINGTAFSVRTLMRDFERITKEVRPEDVLHDLRQAPKRKV